jgi:adenine-specific DNA-methyltransferase
MPIEKLRPSFTFDEDRLAQLWTVVPEAFADGQVNWETLREALGKHLEEEDQEHFGLFWPGKREARRLASQPSKGTLIPQSGLGVNEESTRNLFIEGDNLEVLRLLQKSYARRVKLIYIDPPYNTGNDFIYPDDYSEPLDAYLRRTGQADEAGQLLTTNTRASGRFHSNWLSMMYPRLLLARQLLREDGVILVSIDDNEVHNLRQLMNEVFGDESFLACFIWHRRRNPDSRNQDRASTDHEYVLAYRRPEATLRGKDIDLNKYRNPDNDPRGPWFSADLTGLATKERRPNLHYDVVDPSTSSIRF